AAFLHVEPVRRHAPLLVESRHVYRRLSRRLIDHRIFQPFPPDHPETKPVAMADKPNVRRYLSSDTLDRGVAPEGDYGIRLRCKQRAGAAVVPVPGEDGHARADRRLRLPD